MGVFSFFFVSAMISESWGEDGESGGVSSGNSVRGSRHLSVVVFGWLSIRIFHRARRSSFKGFGFKFRDSRARGERRGVDLLLRLQTTQYGIVDSRSMVQSLRADLDNRS